LAYIAYLLREDHDEHSHPHDHSHHHHRDHNLRAAFVHVMADAAVSAPVIIGLVAARQFGWIWMDPLMGIIATAVILNWSWSLVRAAAAVLLDVSPDPALSTKIVERLETRGDKVSDLHVWRVGPGHMAAIVSLVSDHPETSSAYKQRLSGLSGLSHITVEVERCPSIHL
jgi:cation diffusion facilitator family transporter